MSAYHDIEVGSTLELGTHLFTREAILDFARQFDPQPFHVDEEAARASLFGGLCASGWHTVAVFMRLNVAAAGRIAAARREAGLPAQRVGPSPGVRDLRWLRPVFAGDTIGYRQTVTGKRVSASRPEWGLVTSHVEATNQSGDPVLRMDAQLFVGIDGDGVRPADSGPAPAP